MPAHGFWRTETSETEISHHFCKSLHMAGSSVGFIGSDIAIYMYNSIEKTPNTFMRTPESDYNYLHLFNTSCSDYIFCNRKNSLCRNTCDIMDTPAVQRILSVLHYILSVRNGKVHLISLKMPPSVSDPAPPCTRCSFALWATRCSFPH